MADLVFGSPPAADANLVFGATDANPADTSVVVLATLPLVVSVHVGVLVPVTVQVDFPLDAHVNARYVSGAARPTVSELTAGWQAGVPASASVRHLHTAALPHHVPLDAPWQQGVPLRATAPIKHEAALPVRRAVGVRHQQGVQRRAAAALAYQQAQARRAALTARWQDGAKRRASLALRHQDALRFRNRAAGRWQQGVPQFVPYREDSGNGVPFRQTLDGRYQQAMTPPPGIWDHVIVVPPKEPCYTPSPHLLFQDLPGTPHLVFVCENHDAEGPGEPQVVVPIKRVYVVLNNVWLRKVEGDVMLSALSMSLSLDRDSWTWSFSASLPEQALTHVRRAEDGSPIEVEASINGTLYRFLIETVRRQRQFGRKEIAVSGRGLSAALDQVQMNFSNSGATTAQALMADVLTENGVGIGWDLDFNLTDWNIAAGAFSHQGTYISALTAIANAAGGYVQPTPTGQVLRILPDYPAAPWTWPVTANYELPADVMTTESIEWLERPRYNRVYVTGTQGGPMGRVTRGGTAGEIEAPMVVDALLSDEPAQRQRGISVLGNTGQIAMMGLRLPVLAETGIIVPGRYVKYVDGGVERFGITRGVRVDVGRPEMWQQIEVETHV